jgi:hypothetical protein
MKWGSEYLWYPVSSLTLNHLKLGQAKELFLPLRFHMLPDGEENVGGDMAQSN